MTDQNPKSQNPKNRQPKIQRRGIVPCNLKARQLAAMVLSCRSPAQSLFSRPVNAAT